MIITPSGDAVPQTSIEVTDQSFAEDVEAREGLVLVDFWATWCGPCRVIAPTLEAMASDHSGRLTVAKLDMDENPHTVVRYNVRSAPTLLFMRGGREVQRIVGAVPRARLEAVVDEYA
jgi:thioredoxin 1